MKLFENISKKWNNFLDKKIESMSKGIEKIEKQKLKNSNEIGMYFMDLYSATYKKRHEIENGQLLLDYYHSLGCATQGRLDEVKAMISESEKNKLGLFFNEYSHQILKMTKIAKEVDEKPIGYDLKSGESIGEYFDRKVARRPAFMKEFEFFKNFDIENYLRSIQ